MSTTLNPAEAIKGFAIFGDFVDVKPYGTGHINDTFLATFDQAGAPTPERVAGFLGVGLLLLLGSAVYIRSATREKNQ